MLVTPSRHVLAADTQLEPGKYLVGISGCFNCHTLGNFFGKPDMGLYLAGSDVGFEVPGLGVFVGPQPDVGQGNRPRRLDELGDRNRIADRTPA